MDQEIITYETLYEILRIEKTREELQKLENNFLKNITNYLKEKKIILESQQKKSSIFSSSEAKKTRKQIENAEKMLKELYERRESKIVQLALFASRAQEQQGHDNLLEEEKIFFNTIKNSLDSYRNGLLFNILANKPIEINEKPEPKDIKTPNKPQETKLIRFTQAIPQFLGTDLNIYGPYDKEDVANLPKELAQLLVKKKRAKQL